MLTTSVSERAGPPCCVKVTCPLYACGGSAPRLTISSVAVLPENVPLLGVTLSQLESLRACQVRCPPPELISVMVLCDIAPGLPAPNSIVEFGRRNCNTGEAVDGASMKICVDAASCCASSVAWIACHPRPQLDETISVTVNVPVSFVCASSKSAILLSRLKLIRSLVPKPVPTSVKVSLARKVDCDAVNVSFERGARLLLRKRNARKLVATNNNKQMLVSSTGTVRSFIVGLRGTNGRSSSAGNEGRAVARLYSGMASGAGSLSGGLVTGAVAMRGRSPLKCEREVWGTSSETVLALLGSLPDFPLCGPADSIGNTFLSRPRSDFGIQIAFGFEDADKGDVGRINSSGSSCSLSSTPSRRSAAVLSGGGEANRSDCGSQVAFGFDGVGILSEGALSVS